VRERLHVSSSSECRVAWLRAPGSRGYSAVWSWAEPRAPAVPQASIRNAVSTGQGDKRKRSPEPCAQVRILLGAPKSNTRANFVFLAICRLTWANVRHDPLSPAACAPGTSQDRARPMPPDVSAQAGNGYQDRALARALRGTNPEARAWPALDGMSPEGHITTNLADGQPAVRGRRTGALCMSRSAWPQQAQQRRDFCTD
jgi:hypothetical protein